MAISTLEEWLADEQMNTDDVLRVIGAQMYFNEGNFKQALKLTHNAENFESMTMTVQVYLKIDRLDLAEKVVRSMQEIDDNDTLSQLASSWLYVVQGGEKVNEAYFFLQELLEKFGPNVNTLNMMACAEIHMKKYTEAFSHLKSARDLCIQKAITVNAETLINSMICLRHLQKGPEIISKIQGSCFYCCSLSCLFVSFLTSLYVLLVCVQLSSRVRTPFTHTSSSKQKWLLRSREGRLIMLCLLTRVIKWVIPCRGEGVMDGDR